MLAIRTGEKVVYSGYYSNELARGVPTPPLGHDSPDDFWLVFFAHLYFLKV